MIKSIFINNFQNHKSTVIDFSDGLNVFLGVSDSGKSAIIRAIQWVILCKSPGLAGSFITDGESECAVEIEFDDCSIRRETGSQNKYILNNINGEQEFKAFGTKVPEPVQEAINMDFINFQSQHDTAFLFSSTSGEVAKLLNEIVDLDIIDQATSNINSMIREHDGDAKYITESLEEHRESLEANQLKYDLVKPDIDRANHLDGQMDELCDKLDVIKKKKKDFERLESEIFYTEDSIAEYTKYKGISELIEPVQVLAQKRATKKIEVIKIEKLIREVKKVERDLSCKEVVLHKLKQKWNEQKGTDCPLCEGSGIIHGSV